MLLITFVRPTKLINIYLNNLKNKNMTQLEELQQELAALAKRINSTVVLDNKIVLTREQLKEFANAIQSSTIKKIKNEIEEVNINIDDHVTIELNRLELEINVETYDVLSEISQEISNGDEVTDEDVQTYLDALEK